MAIIIKALVEGGKATPAPPLGPQLAIAKVKIPEVIAAINEKTKDFKGIQVPVEITIHEDKSFDIKVGTPPVSALIKKELKLEKLAKAPFGTYTPKEGEVVEEFKGDLKFEQVVKIANAKKDVLGTRDFKNMVKQVVGSCVSLGVTVEGKTPKEMLEEIDSGKWDDKFK